MSCTRRNNSDVSYLAGASSDKPCARRRIRSSFAYWCGWLPYRSSPRNTSMPDPLSSNKLISVGRAELQPTPVEAVSPELVAGQLQVSSTHHTPQVPLPSTTMFSPYSSSCTCTEVLRRFFHSTRRLWLSRPRSSQILSPPPQAKAIKIHFIVHPKWMFLNSNIMLGSFL